MKKSLLLISLAGAATAWAGCNSCKKAEATPGHTSGSALPGQSGQSGSDDKDGKYKNPPPPQEAPKPGSPDGTKKKNKKD